MPSIIVPDKSLEPIEIEEVDYDAVIGGLREQGRPFELVAETEVIEAGPLALGGAMPSQSQIEGLDSGRDDVALEQAMGVAHADLEETYPDPAVLEKKVRRAANMTLVPPAEFLPGGGMDLGPSPMSPDTYKHFEPPIRLAIEASADPDDVADMKEHGTESEAYQAYAGQQWKLVHDVHQKHNLPVVRVEKLQDSETGGSSIAGGMASLNRMAVPIMLGFDQMAAATVGKEGIAASHGAFSKTPALAELEKMGVIGDQVSRLEEIGEESMGLQMLGGAIALPMYLPQMVGRGAAKLGAAVAGSGKGLKGLARKAAGAATAGATATGAELAGELGVSEAIEAAGGREATVPSEEEAIEMMLMGAGMGVAGNLVGAGSRKYQDYLRSPDTAGGPDLNQMEALLSAAEGKPVRGTSITKPRGLDPGETVLAQKEKVAGQRRTRQDGGPGYAEEAEDIYIDPVKKLTKEMDAKEARVASRIADEADAYHMSPEGLKQIPTAPILARLEAIKASKEGLPLIKTSKITSIIEDFKKKPTMDARELDASLQEVDDIMASNRAAISANRVYRDLSQSMREVRDEFMGNVHTKGGTWSELKTKQSRELQGLSASRDRLGLKNVKMADMDLPTQRATAINAVRSLGKNSSSAEIYSILNDNPKLKKELQRVMANEPHSRMMRGGGGSAPIRETEQIRAAAGQLKYRIDPIAELLEQKLYGQAGKVGQLGALVPTGTGSEQAQAISGKMTASKDALLRMMDAIRTEESKPSRAEER